MGQDVCCQGRRCQVVEDELGVCFGSSSDCSFLPLMRSSSYRDSSRKSLSMKNLSTKMSLSILAIVLILSESLLGAFLRPGHFDDFAADKRSLAPCRCLQLDAGPASTDTDCTFSNVLACSSFAPVSSAGYPKCRTNACLRC